MTKPDPSAATVSELSEPPLRFSGLSLDAVDVPRAAVFWAAALSGSVTDVGGGGLRVDSARGRPDNEIIWVRPTAEPHTVKTRVHVDVRLATETPDDLVHAGATVVRKPGEDPWFVLADPEGNLFCAFPAIDDRRPGIFEIVVDSRDAHAQAAWWQRLIGGTAVEEGEAAAVHGAPGLPWDDLVFDPVPEPKTVRNRMHWHTELRHGSPAMLAGLGATLLRPPGRTRPWHVFADPEGNEFCVHEPQGTWR